MTTKNKAAIDLASGEIHIDLLSGLDVVASPEPTVTDEGYGPMVVVSSDGLVGLELSTFNGLVPHSDIIQLESPSDIAGLIASCEMPPSLFLVEASMVAEVEVVLEELGLDISIIVIAR